jgi:hypothetical protein
MCLLGNESGNLVLCFRVGIYLLNSELNAMFCHAQNSPVCDGVKNCSERAVVKLRNLQILE